MTQNGQQQAERNYHNDDIGSGCLIGDIVAPVNMKQVNNRTVAETKIKFIRVTQAGTQNQKVFVSTWSIEAWSDQAIRLLSKCQPGTTVAILQGSFKNNKHVGQDGQEKWFTAIQVRKLAYMGPSTEAVFDQQRQQQQSNAGGGYAQPAANAGAYGAAPAGNGGGAYGNTSGYVPGGAPAGNVQQGGVAHHGQPQHAPQGAYGQQPAAHGGQNGGGYNPNAQPPQVMQTAPGGDPGMDQIPF